jgi:bifunctional non-homologous end joining protein LigD
MQALRVRDLPVGNWLYELKFDGYRALAFKAGKEVRLLSRNNKPFNYLQLTVSLKLLTIEQVILDGEIVALVEKGRSSFQLLQVYKSSEQRVPLVYYVFDLLFVDRKDLRKEPLSARRNLLADVLKKRKAEAEPRKQRRGLWSDPNPVDPWLFRAVGQTIKLNCYVRLPT